MNTIENPQKHFFNSVTPFSKTLALILFVTLPVLTLYIGYQKGSSEERSREVVIQKEATASPILEQPADGMKLFTGSYPHFGITFNYPNDPRYTVKEYTLNAHDVDMASVDITVMDRALTRILDIRALGKGYCLYEWCMLEKKSTLTTRSATWEYLGSSTYGDGGEIAEFNNIYRTYNGEFPVYVVTEEPIDLTDGSAATQIFDSLTFRN